jgi:Holliday junction resolvasome RuvABC DNA-binding subunit
MIRYLKGVVARKEEGSFLLLVGGVGFQVQAPSPFLQGLREGEEVGVHTHLAPSGRKAFSSSASPRRKASSSLSSSSP